MIIPSDIIPQPSAIADELAMTDMTPKATYQTSDVYLKQSVRTFIAKDHNVTLRQFENLMARTVDMDGNPFLVR